MTEPPLAWLTEVTDEADDDPWVDIDLPDVSLTDAQEAFLATVAEQPEVPRLRGLGGPGAAFEVDGDDPDQAS